LGLWVCGVYHAVGGEERVCAADYDEYEFGYAVVFVWVFVLFQREDV
jgi:hypothetical protein